MKKCIVIPDSFKGTLSSEDVCRIVSEKIKKIEPECEVIAIPVADGGEGTADCFLHAAGAEKIELETCDPYGEPVRAYYARMGETAVIEMAQAAGLPQVEGRENPAETSTYGVGLMVRHAAEHGCKKLVIGLGGSCTNDGGCGLAAAVGTKFYDSHGRRFLPVGGTLKEIKKIDISETEKLLEGCQVTAMCDIDHPMHGVEGAACVFAPQKGADASMVKDLDENLKALDQKIREELGKEVASIPGAGAAGALGAGVVAFLGGKLQPGIQVILDLVRLDKALDGADLVITGEGRIDSQSLHGKVVIGVAERAKRKGVPVLAVVGSVGEDAEKAYDMGVTAIFSINRQAVDFSVSRYQAEENLAATVEDLLRFQKAFRKTN